MAEALGEVALELRFEKYQIFNMNIMDTQVRRAKAHIACTMN
jgi:hypothetical protein